MTQIRKTLNSALELKNIYALTAVAMLLALRVVLGLFANASLPMFGNTIKLSAAFMPIAVAGAMFGPIPAALVGALGDIISFLIAPTGAYFPGFTISGALTGLIYGYVFYKKQITIPKVLIAWFANTLIVETFLSAYWLYLLYSSNSGTPYEVYLYARLISQAIKAVPEMLVLFGLGKLCEKLKLVSFKPKKRKR